MRGEYSTAEKKSDRDQQIGAKAELMRAIRAIFNQAIFLLPLLLGGCGERVSPNFHTIQGMELGTTYTIIVEEKDSAGLQSEIDGLFEEANNSMSLYSPNSLISRINRGETDSLDRHLTYCIELAQVVSKMSGGLYDITVKPLSEAWGFLDKRAEVGKELNIDSLLQYVGYQKIGVEDGRLIREARGVQIDLNSIAKGYIVDLMGEMLIQRGVENFMVEVGGEIVCRGVNKRGGEWVIGIDSPYDGNIVSGEQLQAKISFTDAGMATSGNYRKYYVDEQGRKVVHIINPLTGYSEPSTLLSTTVVANSAALADALCTMLMVMGEERAKEFVENNPQYPTYLVYDGGEEEFRVFYNTTFEKLIEK